jgi:hypothetical protein
LDFHEYGAQFEGPVEVLALSVTDDDEEETNGMCLVVVKWRGVRKWGLRGRALVMVGGVRLTEPLRVRAISFSLFLSEMLAEVDVFVGIM